MVWEDDIKNTVLGLDLVNNKWRYLSSFREKNCMKTCGLELSSFTAWSISLSLFYNFYGSNVGTKGLKNRMAEQFKFKAAKQWHLMLIVLWKDKKIFE